MKFIDVPPKFRSDLLNKMGHSNLVSTPIKKDLQETITHFIKDLPKKYRSDAVLNIQKIQNRISTDAVNMLEAKELRILHLEAELKKHKDGLNKVLETLRSLNKK